MFHRHCIAALLVCGGLVYCRAAAGDSQQPPARDYLIHVWQTDDGLPENWVSSITQTPDGYLWVGTRYGGLARFDGVRFVAFTQQTTDQLKDVQVEHLSVDETGRLWIIMGNESITAFENGRFQLFRWPRSEPRLRNDHVLSVRSNKVLFAGEFPYLTRLTLPVVTNGWEIIAPPANAEPDVRTFCIDGDDTVWFITHDHLGCFSSDGYEVLLSASGLPEPTVVATAVDAKGHLWVATPHHLLTGGRGGFVERTPNNGPALEGIQQIAFSGDGGLWVLEKNRLRKCLNNQWKVEANPQRFRPDMTSDTFSLHGDAEGNAWLISIGHGLWHVKSDGSVSLLTEKSGLPSVFITCWFQDAEGDVWIGTAGGGIARIRESLFHALGQAEGLPGKVVRSVCVDQQGQLWAGTMSGGLARLEDGRFTSVPLPATNSNPTESVTVFPAKDGGLWIGTLNHALMRLHSGKITRPATPWGTVRVLFGDSQGGLWVGGLVNLFHLSNGRYTTYGSGNGFVDSHAIGAVAEDAKGTIWIGTGPGDLWSFRDGKFTRFTPPTKWPSVRFSAVLPDTNGVIWIGTLGGGLLRFRDGVFTRCTKSNGLPDDNVSQLLDSRDGYLWAGTYAGIFRARKDRLEDVALGRAPRVPCRVYGRFDGLPALECSSGFQPSCWRSVDGKLYFSTANGVVTVNPLEITSNSVPPRVIIEEMLVDGKPRSLPTEAMLPSKSRVVRAVRIEPGQHYVQFRFTGLNFAAPDGVRFRVKLEGVEEEWQSPAERLIGYGPLPPGDYRFRVIACNNDGVWNEKGDTLAFTVLPYFWETWWFRITIMIAALTALGATVALVQRRRYRRRLELAERQREMERERARIARDLHDDLGTSLTQISMLSALANRDQALAPEARELIQQVRGRARAMVTALDEIVWAVNPKNDSLVGLVNYLGHFAEEFYRPTNIRCRLDIPRELPRHPLTSELRHHLFLAFKEAVNNAARHSHAAHVRIRIETRPAEVVISVEDDGQGFETQPDTISPQALQRNGLVNLRQRIAQLGGRVEIRSVVGKGTTVVFHVPLNDSEHRA